MLIECFRGIDKYSGIYIKIYKPSIKHNSSLELFLHMYLVKIFHVLFFFFLSFFFVFFFFHFSKFHIFHFLNIIRKSIYDLIYRDLREKREIHRETI